MASKLTLEQKLLNKTATKLRDSLYHKRKASYRAERDAVAATLATSAVALAAEVADAAFDLAREERDATLAALRVEMQALEQRMADEIRLAADRLMPLTAARRTAWDARRKEQQTMEAAVDAKYPDVADCWSAAEWKSFKEFLPPELGS